MEVRVQSMVGDNQRAELKMFSKELKPQVCCIQVFLSAIQKHIFQRFSTPLDFQMVDCVAAFSTLSQCCGGGEAHKEDVRDGEKERHNWKLLLPNPSKNKIVFCFKTVKFV